MASRTLISVEEYLRARYRPDCDYVDGQIEERNEGEKSHSKLQKALLLYLAARERQWGIFAIQEQRIQVDSARFRVPDLCVTLSEPDEQVFSAPPFLCVEILSPEDRVGRLEDRVDDYLNMGVPYVWILDPRTKRAWVATAKDGWREEKSGLLKTENPALEVPLAEIFA